MQSPKKHHELREIVVTVTGPSCAISAQECLDLRQGAAFGSVARGVAVLA